MKRFWIALGFVWGTTLTASATAQPILNRVEGFLRDQVEAAKQSQPTAEPGYLGLIADDAGNGVRVLDVVAGHAAERAGLKKGDLITEVDGRPIRVMDDMAAALAGKPAGAKFSLTATRAGTQQQFNVTLGRRAGEPAANQGTLPAPSEPAVRLDAPRPRLGVRSVPVSEAVRQQNNLPNTRGAQIISVIVDSPAEQAQIPLGAVVTAVGATPVGTPQELAAAIAGVKQNDVELSYVYRGQSARRKVVLQAPAAAADQPKREVRARLPLSEAPGPSGAAADRATPDDLPQSVASPVVENPALERETRIEALERHVKQLESRIKSLEAELSRQKPADGAEPK